MIPPAAIRNARRPLVGGLALLALVAAACGGDGDDGAAGSATATAGTPRISARVDHPLVPLASVHRTVLEGTERDPDTGERLRIRVDARVRAKPDRVGGIPVTVVEVRDFEDGEVVERTLDYYAQRANGDVLYVGERIDDIEGGKVVGHQGQWLTGRKGARPGIFMLARPKVGDAFQQERAPGVAEDRSTVVAVGLRVRTPAGRFKGCIKTKDYGPLDKVTEFKHYCPGVGLVREEEPGSRADLVRYR